MCCSVCKLPQEGSCGLGVVVTRRPSKSKSGDRTPQPVPFPCPLAQWIEHGPAKAGAQVRLLCGQLMSRKSQVRSLGREPGRDGRDTHTTLHFMVFWRNWTALPALTRAGLGSTPRGTTISCTSGSLVVSTRLISEFSLVRFQGCVPHRVAEWISPGLLNRRT